MKHFALKNAMWSESFPVIFELRILLPAENFSRRETQIIALKSVRTLCDYFDAKRVTNVPEFT